MLLVGCLKAWRCDCARFKVGITAALMAAFFSVVFVIVMVLSPYKIINSFRCQEFVRCA